MKSCNRALYIYFVFGRAKNKQAQVCQLTNVNSFKAGLLNVLLFKKDKQTRWQHGLAPVTSLIVNSFWGFKAFYAQGFVEI